MDSVSSIKPGMQIYFIFYRLKFNRMITGLDKLILFPVVHTDGIMSNSGDIFQMPDFYQRGVVMPCPAKNVRKIGLIKPSSCFQKYLQQHFQ